MPKKIKTLKEKALLTILIVIGLLMAGGILEVVLEAIEEFFDKIF